MAPFTFFKMFIRLLRHKSHRLILTMAYRVFVHFAPSPTFTVKVRDRFIVNGHWLGLGLPLGLEVSLGLCI